MKLTHEEFLQQYMLNSVLCPSPNNLGPGRAFTDAEYAWDRIQDSIKTDATKGGAALARLVTGGKS